MTQPLPASLTLWIFEEGTALDQSGRKKAEAALKSRYNIWGESPTHPEIIDLESVCWMV